jgi:hypothetical protein
MIQVICGVLNIISLYVSYPYTTFLTISFCSSRLTPGDGVNIATRFEALSVTGRSAHPGAHPVAQITICRPG